MPNDEDETKDDGYLSSDEEMLYDENVRQVRQTLQNRYSKDLEEVRGYVWVWSERLDTFLLPYIGFSLFLAPERYFKMSRFAGLATLLLGLVLITFLAGAGQMSCAICTTAYPLYQTLKFLAAISRRDTSSENSDSTIHSEEFIQWSSYWMIFGAFGVFEQVVMATIFQQGMHWSYWCV